MKKNGGRQIFFNEKWAPIKKALPIVTNYQRVDFKEGVAPYFREELRHQVTKILGEKDDKGKD